MNNAPDLNAIADAVIAAHKVIEKHGTRGMKTMSRALLLTIGREIARHSSLPQEAVDLSPVDGEPLRRLFATRP